MIKNIPVQVYLYKPTYYTAFQTKCKTPFQLATVLNFTLNIQYIIAMDSSLSSLQALNEIVVTSFRKSIRKLGMRVFL